MEPLTSEYSNWRKYQSRLKKTTVKKHFIRATIKFSVVLCILIFIIYSIDDRLGDATNYKALEEFAELGKEKAGTLQKEHNLLNKSEVRSLLSDFTLVNLKDKGFYHSFEGQKVRIETSLDISLQRFIQKKMNRSSSRYIGIVAMDPATGKILLMTGFDKDDPDNNPCLDSRFPAASIFKIVTAAAAIEKCNFNPASVFAFNGRKHTLYKSQLRNKKNKYTNRITLRDSFAQSVNPVFGKIGAIHLGAPVLEAYAAAFGFNRHIEFEIPVSPSTVNFSDEPYQWAEIASGFNRETTISPLHGAMIAAAIANSGMLMEPTIVDSITDDKGETIYKSHLKTMNQALSTRASDMLNTLMAATVKSGTARKAFRGYRRDRILSRLNIGGKTGSIGGETHDDRYDWFVGFAEEKQGDQKIVISAVVAHEKYIGTRSYNYARMAIRHYFHDYFKNINARVDREHPS